MKTPEEIKKGLRICKRNHCSKECPYHDEKGCYVGLHSDALAYIQQLARERDDALTLIGKLAVILKKYPRAATNGCAYEAHMEIKKYLLTVANKQEECM